MYQTDLCSDEDNTKPNRAHNNYSHGTNPHLINRLDPNTIRKNHRSTPVFAPNPRKRRTIFAAPIQYPRTFSLGKKMFTNFPPSLVICIFCDREPKPKSTRLCVEICRVPSRPLRRRGFRGSPDLAVLGIYTLRTESKIKFRWKVSFGIRKSPGEVVGKKLVLTFSARFRRSMLIYYIVGNFPLMDRFFDFLFYVIIIHEQILDLILI